MSEVCVGCEEVYCLCRRIVFSSFEKFDGREMRPLTAAEVKQIAGRAGRYGSRYQEGVVTCLNAVSSTAMHAATHRLVNKAGYSKVTL